MKVLQLISSGGMFGAENMLLALSLALQREACRVSVAVFGDRREPHLEIAEACRESGLDVITISCRGRWDSEAVRTLSKWIAKSGADVLHCHGYKADIFGGMASQGLRIARISTCHNWPDRRWLMRAYAALDRRMLRRFDFIGTPSRQVARILSRSGIAEGKIVQIGNGIDTCRFGAGSRQSRKRQAIGFAGRFVHGKGGAVLLEAAAEVLREQPSARFVFAGDGPCRKEWEELARRRGISSNVVFIGTRRDMPAVYSSFDVLALPSDEEAMPMCVLEAMAAGVPVVATAVGSVPDLIEDHVNGILIPPRRPDALSRAILRLLGDDEWARMLGENGRRCVEQNHSSTRMSAQYRELYDRALTRI